MRVRWSVRGLLAAGCALVVLLAGVPGRAFAAAPERATSPAGGLRVSAADSHVTLEIDLSGGFDADRLAEWVEQVELAHPVLSDALKDNLRAYELDPPIVVDDLDWVDSDGYFDTDAPGAFVQSVGVRGLSVHIGGLTPGHHYVVAVTTWNAAGGGLPGVAGTVVV